MLGVLGLGVLAAVVVLLLGGRDGPSAPQPTAPRTALGKHVLEKPIDPAQQTDLSFGDRSHWLQPWRAYLDTQPAARMRAAPGINFDVAPDAAEATAQVLGEAGFKRARIEIGWSEVSPGDPSRLKDPAALRVVIGALKRHGLRPLILLNANQTQPGPTEFFDAQLRSPAAAGASRVRLDPATTKRVRAGRSGLNQGDKAAGILFTKVGRSGLAELSKPLPGPLPKGPQKAATLAFAPFQDPESPDGTPNPAFESTLKGWLDYVAAVTGETKRALGSDAFDVEVWNELSFGSDFLDAGTYYQESPPGEGDAKQEILRRTLRFIRDPRHGVADVRVGNGFANQTPFAAGSTSPAGLTAIDKHPYPRLRQFPGDEGGDQDPLDARGDPDGEPFTPAYRAFFPEYYLSAIQTETLVRDLSPLATDVNGVQHGRATGPDGFPPPTMWITELNLDLSGGDPANPDAPKPAEGVALATGAAQIQAKGVLRSLSAYVNKGVSAIDFYAARDPGFALVPPSFYEAAGRAGGYPGFGQAGVTLTATRRFLRGFSGPARIANRRQLRLAAVGEDHDHRQFAGDGSREHPPLYNRDVLAFLPFQVTDDRFLAPVYVMTRDLSKPLSPERYRLEVQGVSGRSTRVSATDPLTGKPSPAKIVRRAAKSVVVEMTVTDSPRLLGIDD